MWFLGGFDMSLRLGQSRKLKTLEGEGKYGNSGACRYLERKLLQ